MTDAERLEKWYAEQNFIPGVKSIFHANCNNKLNIER